MQPVGRYAVGLFAICHGSTVLAVDVGDFVAKGIGLSSFFSNTTQASTLPLSAGVLRTTSTVNSSAQINPSTQTNSTLNVTCNDAVCASACSDSWASWSSAAATWTSENAKVVTTTTVVSYNASTATIPLGTVNGSAYATCNDIQRYASGFYFTGTSETVVSPTSTTWDVLSTSLPGNFSKPKPTCAISTDRCVDLKEEWHAKNYMATPFNSTKGFVLTWPEGTAPPDYPHCNTSNHGWDPSGCWLKAANARLYYWPEADQEHPGLNKTATTATGSTCPPGTYTLPPTQPLNGIDAGPVTTVMTFSESYYNCCTTTMTLTSPSVYLSMQDVEARDGMWGFAGAGPVPATVIALDPTQLTSQILDFPMITNAAQSTSAMSIIANQQREKYTDLFGINWYSQAGNLNPYAIEGPNVQFKTVQANPADFGKPPPPLSYYFGAAGWYCLNGDAFAVHYQPISVGLPGGMPCNSIFDDSYRPWVQIPSAVKAGPSASCNLGFGWDPPIALTPAQTIKGAPAALSPESTIKVPSFPVPGKTTPDVPIALTPESTVEVPTNPAPGPTITSSPPKTTPSATQAEPQTSTAQPPPAEIPSRNSVDVPQGPPQSTNIAVPQPDPPREPERAEPDQNSSLGSNPGNAGHGVDTPSPSGTNDNPSVSVTVIDLGGDVQPTQAFHPTVSAIIGSGPDVVTVIAAQGQTIAHSAGGSAVLQPGTTNLGGQPVSIDNSGQVVAGGTSTVNLSPLSNDHVSAIVFGGQTLLSGQPAMTANGVTFSAEAHGGDIVAASEGTTRTLTPQSDGIVQLGRGQQATLTTVPVTNAMQSGMVVAGLTFLPGGPAYVKDGVRYSVLPSGSGVVEVSSGHTKTLTIQQGGVVQLEGKNQQATITAIDLNAEQIGLVIAGHTVLPDSEVSVKNGLTISALPSGSGVVVIQNGQTSTVTSLSGSVFDLGGGEYATLVTQQGADASLPATTTLGHTFSRLPDGDVLVDGTTVTSGSRETTIGSLVYSLGSDGTLEIVGASGSAGGTGQGLKDATASATAETTSSLGSAETGDGGETQTSPPDKSGASGMIVSSMTFAILVGMLGFVGLIAIK